MFLFISHYGMESGMIYEFWQEGRVDDELYDQLEQAMAEARNSRREAFEESVRRGQAEKDAIEAIRRVNFTD